MRLIDADELKPSYIITSTTTNSPCHLYVSIEDINSAPTIEAMQVVRCKECKHSVYDELFRMRWCGGEEVNDDDFCSYGERENDEND